MTNFLDQSTQKILDIAILLVESGKSTIESAFLDALELDRNHTQNLMSVLYFNNKLSNQPHAEVIEGMRETVYSRFKSENK